MGQVSWCTWSAWHQGWGPRAWMNPPQEREYCHNLNKLTCIIMWQLGVLVCLTVPGSICSNCICKVLNSQDLLSCIYSWNRPQEWLYKLPSMTLIHPWSIQCPLERESLAVCLCWLPRFLPETQPVSHAGVRHSASLHRTTLLTEELDWLCCTGLQSVSQAFAGVVYVVKSETFSPAKSHPDVS